MSVMEVVYINMFNIETNPLGGFSSELEKMLRRKFAIISHVAPTWPFYIKRPEVLRTFIDTDIASATVWISTAQQKELKSYIIIHQAKVEMW